MTELQVLNKVRCLCQGLHGISLEYLRSYGQSSVRVEADGRLTMFAIGFPGSNVPGMI